MTSTKLFTVSQIRQLEKLAIEQYDIPATALMQRAGQAALIALKNTWPNARYLTVFCGPGNNGGDGYVLAYLAQRMGLHVVVRQVGDMAKQSPEAQQARELCEKHQVMITPFDGEIKKTDVIVDALLGIGLQGVVQEEFAAAIEAINQAVHPVFALDVPSGVNADSANVAAAAVKADATMTFIGLKPGLLTGFGKAHSGKVLLNDLQIPADCLQAETAIGHTLRYHDFSSILPVRALNAHKNDFGHLLIVGGNRGFNGAVRMAAESALRVGAGLVSVATHPDHAAMVNCRLPEIMPHPVKHPRQIRKLLSKATAVVLGPGLGLNAWAKMCYAEVINSHKPMVVDADALNLLAKKPFAQDNWVLTPHPGEAARLLDCNTKAIQADRLTAVKALYDKYHGACILKGAGSLLFARDLQTRVLLDGNPGMASGGMGDILSGVVGSLLAQGMPQVHAVELGLCLHAHAADLTAASGEHGLLASDCIPIIHRLVNQL